MIQLSSRDLLIGVDRAKMRLYDCEQKAQEDILDNGQEEEYNKEEKVSKEILTVKRIGKVLIMSMVFHVMGWTPWRLQTHKNQQPSYKGYTLVRKVDLDKYALFVDGVTSNPSKDYQSFLESLSTLDGEGSNIHFTAAVGISAEGGEFMEIVKKMVFQV